MKERILGRTGLSCSEIGLGTWAFASNVYGDVEKSNSIDVIRYALDRGINFYDTAPLYGNEHEDGIAERILGEGLGNDRDKVIISTKFGRQPTLGPLNAQFHAEGVRRSVEASLKRINTDRIDVLFFHSPFGTDTIHDDVWGEIGELKQEGKLRFIGHSISKFEETEQWARSWADERKIDIIQVVYSLMNRESLPLIEDLVKGEIGVVARESLANGFLSGAIKRDTVFPENNLNCRYSREEIIERVEYAESLDFLIDGQIKSLPQAALRWVLDDVPVSLVLSGATCVEHLSDAIEASEATPYGEVSLARAREIHTKDFSAA
jgi:aryl-alcohol dehydrogenase-like predicted oxidoreductase